MISFNKQTSVLQFSHIVEILTKIKPPALTSKPHKIDNERLLYSQLLDYAGKYLNRIAGSEVKSKSVGHTDSLKDLMSLFFIPLFEQMINLSKRQCGQKAALLKLLLDFYQQGIKIAEDTCQQKLQSLTAEYLLNLKQKTQQFDKTQKELKDKIKVFQEENNKKWKTFYLIVRDNRVLRRQKGKLLRVIQEERVKISQMHEQMIRIARENEKNRLLANYQEEKESLNLFMENSLSISKLENFMKNYPKLAKKILKIDLHHLEVIEQNSLNEKVEYIIKTAGEFEEIYDQYEDLIEISKPNRILFNVSTQTESQQVPISSQQIPFKAFKMSKFVQTYPIPFIIQSETVSVCIGKREPYDKYRRRQAAQIEKPDIDKIKNFGKTNPSVKHNLSMVKGVLAVIFLGKMSRIDLQLQSRVINLAFGTKNFNEVNNYPLLPTKHKLNKDISRSKEYTYKNSSQRSSIFSGITNQTSLEPSESTMNAIESSKFKTKKKGILPTRKNSQNNFSINVSHTRFSFQAFENGRSSTNNIKLGRLNTENLEVSTAFENIDEWRQVIDEAEEAKFHHFQEGNEIFRNEIQQENNLNCFGSKKDIKDLTNTDKMLVLPKTSSKKLRKSGFAINKHSSKQLNFPTDSTNRGNAKPNSEMKSEANESAEPQETDKMVGVSKDRNLRQTIQTKTINVFSQEYSRMADKLLKAIFTQRKEISQGKITFETFIRSFLVNQYGSHLQFVLMSRVTTSRTEYSPLAQVFDLLLNSYQSTSYLQTVFALFAKVLSVSGSSLIQIDSEKASLIQSQMLRSYLGEESCPEIEGDSVSLCSLFIQIQQRIRSTLFNCQLYRFLQLILPKSQLILSYQEVRQIVGIFIGQEDYYRHLLSLKQFCKGQVSPFSFCAFAFREKWTHLLNIREFITQKYKSFFATLEEDWTELIYLKCSRSEHLRWTLNLLKNGMMRIATEEEERVKSQYLSLLFVASEVEKALPISQSLLDISLQYQVITIKKNLNSDS